MNGPLLHLTGKTGAAFLLKHVALKNAVIEHADGIVTIRAGAPYVVVQVHDLLPHANLRDTGWRIVQEALDVRAATHRDALATRRAEHEYLCWKNVPGGRELTIVDTMHSTWDMEAHGIVSDASSPQPIIRPVPYHAALRFYRLSQLSEDLFDAFRNAYLALECLVSDESNIRPGESEKAWLRRVLHGHFAQAISPDTSITTLVDSIYGSGRLPIFHAKTGRDFYLPQGPKRAEIQNIFEKLQWLLASLLQFKFGEQVIGSWGGMSQELKDSRSRVCCHADEVVYECQDEMSREKVKMVVVENPRRFGQLWAYCLTSKPKSLIALSRIVFFQNAEPAIWCNLEENIALEDVTEIRVELNFLDSNSKAPNPLHQA
jgi:hypothetical protein